MKLTEFRQRYPMYDDVPDRELADRLYARHYSDVPRARFDAQIGLAVEERTFGEAAADLGVSFAGGAGAMVENLGQVGALVTGGGDNVLTEAGSSAREFWQARKSPGLQAREQRRAQAIEGADGVVDQALTAAGETLLDPALLTSWLAEQAPMLAPSAAAGRVAGAGASALGAGSTTAGRVATTAAVGTGAVQQGADVGGDAYQSLLAMSPELWGQNTAYQALRAAGVEDAAARHTVALELARDAGLKSALVSAATNLIPGARVLERALVGAKSPSAGKLRAMVQGAFGEAAQEMTEEGAGQALGNLARQEVDPSIETTEGVGEAIGMAAPAGFFGAAGGLASGGAAPQPSPQAPAAAPAAPQPAPAPATAPPQPAAPASVQQAQPDAASAPPAVPTSEPAPSTAEIRAPSGEAFATQRGAELHARMKGISGYHAAPTEDGWVLRRDGLTVDLGPPAFEPLRPRPPAAVVPATEPVLLHEGRSGQPATQEGAGLRAVPPPAVAQPGTDSASVAPGLDTAPPVQDSTLIFAASNEAPKVNTGAVDAAAQAVTSPLAPAAPPGSAVEPTPAPRAGEVVTPRQDFLAELRGELRDQAVAAVDAWRAGDQAPFAEMVRDAEGDIEIAVAREAARAIGINPERYPSLQMSEQQAARALEELRAGIAGTDASAGVQAKRDATAAPALVTAPATSTETPSPDMLTPAERRRAEAAERSRAARLKERQVAKDDDLLAAIAKLGGLQRDNAAAEGVDPAEFDRRGYKIYRVFTKAGVPADEMMQRLEDAGFDFEGYDGVGYNRLWRALTDALGGQRILTGRGLEDAVEAQIADFEDAALQRAEYEAATADQLADPRDDLEPGAMLTDDDAYTDTMDAFGRRAMELAARADAIEDGAGEQLLEDAARRDLDNEATIEALEEWIRDRAGESGAQPPARVEGAGLEADVQEVQGTDAGRARREPESRERPAREEVADPDDDVPFSRRGTGGMTRAAVAAAIDPMLARWNNAPRVHVVDTVVQLIGRTGIRHIPFDADGMWHDGAAWLVGENIPNAERAQRVLIHEAIGHGGLRAILGDRLVPVLDQVLMTHQAKRLDGVGPSLAEIAARYELDLSQRKDRLLAAEEYLAVTAEMTDPPPRLQAILDRLYALIREALRTIAPQLELGASEVRDLLARARAHVERRGAPTGARAPAFSRARGDDRTIDLFGQPASQRRQAPERAASQGDMFGAATREDESVSRRQALERERAERDREAARRADEAAGESAGPLFEPAEREESGQLDLPTAPEPEQDAPLVAYRNEEDGTEARIVRHDSGGYSVTLWDTDADAALPQARIFPDMERADAYARSLVAAPGQKGAERDASGQRELPDILTPVSQRRAGKIEDLGEKIGGARKDTAVATGPRRARTKPQEQVPAWRKRFVAMEKIDRATKRGTGKWQIVDTGTKYGRVIARDFDSQEAAEAAVPLAAVAVKHSVYDATPRKEGAKPNFEIVRRVTDRKRVTLHDGFESREEAMLYMAEHAEEILERNTVLREDILARPEKVRRRGPERRQGDVTGDDFMATFGFRAVEFGNWNNQEERQEVMNHAYDGLLDLAELLNVPPKALSLNGDLALAFGARGHGLSSAAAHYEPSYGVINLTKMQGAGHLAHEWFHALDHYFARQDGKTASERTANERGHRVYPSGSNRGDYMASHGFKRAGSGVRPEVQERIRSLMRTMFRRAEEYVEDTARAEKFVGGARDALAGALNDIRANLAKDLDPRYYKRKNKAASPEQLAQFDAIAERLIEGQDLETRFVALEPPKGRRQRLSFNGRQSNDSLEAISAILKEVRGRGGFDSTNHQGTLDYLRGHMTRYRQRIEMLDSARNADTKVRQVPTDFAMDAKRMDQGSATDYWTTEHEMAARAFSAYVEDKLAERDGASDFMSYGSDNKFYKIMGVRPFPEGAERKALNAEFDALFETLETRETDTGVAMFSRSTPITPPGPPLGAGPPAVPPSGNAHLASLIAKAAGPKPATFAARWRAFKQDLRDRVVQAGVDDLHGLRRLERAAGIAEDEMAAVRAQLARGTDTRVWVALSKGPLKWRADGSTTWDRNGKGLLEILEPVAAQMDLFQAYLMARRARRLLGEGRERFVSRDEIAAMDAYLAAHPDQAALFERVNDEWQAYNAAHLAFAVEAGYLSQAMADTWTREADYVPFYRVLGDDVSNAKGPMQGGRTLQAGELHRLKGGESATANLFDNMIRNTAFLIEAATKNDALRRAVENLEGTGVISRAPAKFRKSLVALGDVKRQIKDPNSPLHAIAQTLEDAGIDLDTIPTGTWQGFASMTTVHRPEGPVVRLKVDGKNEWYTVHDPLLLRALTAVNQEQFGRWIEVFRLPKQFLTGMVTATPTFWVANALRDTQQAYVMIEGQKVPFIAAIKGAADALRQDETFWEMMASGGGFHSGFVRAGDPEATAKIARKEMRGKDFQSTVLDSPRKLIDFWQDLGSAFENANRLSVYRAAEQRGDNHLMRAFEARDFLDFSMRGDGLAMRFLVESVPFLNARAQGLYKLGRAAHQHPASFFIKGALIAAASILLWWDNKDDERYQEMEDWRRDLYYHFWLGDEHYELPKGFEVGFVFGTVPERLMDALYQGSDEAGKVLIERLVWNIREVFAVSPPQTMTPIIEQVANYNFFRKAPIEGLGDEALPAQDRYNTWTHPTSVAIGQALNLSPKRIDHLVQAYGGSVADFVLTMSDQIVRYMGDYPAQPTLRTDEIPFVQRFARGSGPPKATKYREQFYELAKETERAWNAFRKARLEQNTDREAELLAENLGELRAAPFMAGMRRQLAEYNKQLRAIYRDQTMSADAKRAAIDRIIAAKNTAEKRAVQQGKKLVAGAQGVAAR